AAWMGGNRPALEAAEMDWGAVETARVAFHVSERPSIAIATSGPDAEQARQAALMRYYRDRNPAAAKAAWAQQPRAPAGPTELAMMADAEADTGSEAALPLIDALRAYQPTEADTMLGALRLRQGRIEEAADAIARALRAFQTDPWAQTAFKLRALALATEAAERQVTTAPRLYDALTQPFAVRAVDDARRMTAAYMTRVLPFPGACVVALHAIDPHLPPPPPLPTPPLAPPT